MSAIVSLLSLLLVLVALYQLAVLFFEFLFGGRHKPVVFIRGYDQHVAFHVVVKASAKFGAGDLVLPFLAFFHGEVNLDGHARKRVLLEPERRNEEAVNDVLRFEREFHWPAHRDNERGQLGVIATRGITGVESDKVER